MNIDVSATEQQNYQWKIQSEQINDMKKIIEIYPYAIETLGRALSVVRINAMFIPTSSAILIDPLQREFYSLPQNIIKFKLKKDFEHNDNEFVPEYTHQIFGRNKIIFGYKNLKINFYCLSSSFIFCFNVNYDEKINQEQNQELQTDDISQLLINWIPSSITTTSLDLFLSKIKYENEYLPFGKQLFNYKLKGEESSPYFIYCINQNYFNNSRFIEWFSGFETFVKFFINSESTINNKDFKMIIYLLYQQYQNNNKQICYTPIGFSTLHLYYAYPDKKRPRISQILILPPYQRKGHGRHLLTTIYNDLRKDSCVQDITAEDPSDKFIALRDLVSLELCHKYLPDLFSKESILKTNRLTK
ncbi:unnamed protein product [Rotaria sp. Silwood2]|nr:unnamed protein product [Rotaria sp. Silwood2]